MPSTVTCINKLKYIHIIDDFRGNSMVPFLKTGGDYTGVGSIVPSGSLPNSFVPSPEQKEVRGGQVFRDPEPNPWRHKQGDKGRRYVSDFPRASLDPSSFPSQYPSITFSSSFKVFPPDAWRPS